MQVFAKAHSEHEEIGELQTATLSRQEKLKLVAVRAGLFLLLAVAALPIPMLHFILVPLFLICAVFAGLSASGYAEKVSGGEVPCPHCKARIQVPESPLKWPLTCVCQSCASSVRLYKESQRHASL